MPVVLVAVDDAHADTGLGVGIVAVSSCTSEVFSVSVEIQSSFGKRELSVRARREQIPLTIATASSLYTLQGMTATPGRKHCVLFRLNLYDIYELIIIKNFFFNSI
jgi:hypothetical protein